jgi:gas vesicle protein
MNENRSNDYYRSLEAEAGHSGGMFAAFALGLVAGAVTSLLLAPASGAETRRRLGEFAGKMGDKAREGAETARHYVSDAKSRIEHAVEEGKAAYQRERTTTGTGMGVGPPS